LTQTCGFNTGLEDANLFESQRRMSGACLQKIEILIGKIPGCFVAVADSETRTPERRNASKRAAASSFEILVSSFTRRIQSTSLDVLFDLTIPLISHKLLKPCRETH
jgi:hypothetical protein